MPDLERKWFCFARRHSQKQEIPGVIELQIFVQGGQRFADFLAKSQVEIPQSGACR